MRDYRTLEMQRNRLAELIELAQSATDKLKYIDSQWYYLKNKGRKLSYVQQRLAKINKKIRQFRRELQQTKHHSSNITFVRKEDE